MLAEEEEPPLKLTSKEQEEVDERRAAGVMVADRRLDELQNALDRRMERGDYQVQARRGRVSLLPSKKSTATGLQEVVREI